MTSRAEPSGRTEPPDRAKDRPEYRFEIKYGAQYIDPTDIEWEAGVLMKRLEVPDEPRVGPVLKRFVRDTVFAIEWYEARLKRLRIERYIWTGLMVALILGAFSALGVILFVESSSGDVAPIAEFSALVAGLFGLLKLLGTLTDSSKRMAAWHQARSQLKEILYGLETDWRGRARREDETWDPEFEKAVIDGTRSARAVLDAEQQAYFQSVASPTSLLDVVTGSTNRLRDDVDRIVASRDADRGIASRDAQQEAQDELDRAKARERAARRWLERLEGAEQRDEAAIEDARDQLMAAERTRILAEEELTARRG